MRYDIEIDAMSTDEWVEIVDRYLYPARKAFIAGAYRREELSLKVLVPTQNAVSSEIVEKYQEQIYAGKGIPPIQVVGFDGVYYIWDGHHRWYAAKSEGMDVVPVELVIVGCGCGDKGRFQ